MGLTPAIRVEQLSKRYRLGAAEGRADTFVGAFGQLVRTPLRNLRRIRQLSNFAHDESVLWALKAVSFDVNPGEVVGIIGHNGAGKSTLLKVLSRITFPTSGCVYLHGRVSSLLEVGTGFHPELTGAENIYLNGTILGMTKAEVDAKYDEIVDFSGVEAFLDTPIKRYSSGMRVRLAFSVAAHLEPEILLIDEVLAVGDAAFRQKSMSKMSSVARSGRTVLFVSHNMSAVEQLCGRVIYLHQGQVAADGPAHDTIMHYMAQLNAAADPINLFERTDREGGDRLRFDYILLTDAQGHAVETIRAGEPLIVRLGYRSMTGEALTGGDFAVRVDSLVQQKLFTAATKFTQQHFAHLPPRGEVRCIIAQVPLLEGTYKLYLWAGLHQTLGDRIHDAARFHVIRADVFNTGEFPNANTHGMIYVPHRWELHELASPQPA